MSDTFLDVPYLPDSGRVDPVIAELRAAREALAEEVGHDLHRLHLLLHEIEEAERAAGRVILPPPERPRRSDAA